MLIKKCKQFLLETNTIYQLRCVLESKILELEGIQMNYKNNHKLLDYLTKNFNPNQVTSNEYSRITQQREFDILIK